MPRSPRYLELAGELRQAIAKGAFAIGAHLPTEFELCDAHQVSRHTARAALKVLEDADLIERKPGLGTRVIAQAQSPAFVQPLGGLDELLQYARDARLQGLTSSRARLSVSQARRLGAPAGGDWLRIDGVRRAGSKPIAAASVYVLGAIGARPADFIKTSRAFIEVIEQRYGVAVASIHQTIRAELLDTDDAVLLGAAQGAPSLRAIRRYHDASDRLFVVSDTRHPADRFAYEMTYRREGALK